MLYSLTVFRVGGLAIDWLVLALCVGCGEVPSGYASNAKNSDAGAETGACAPKTCVQLDVTCGLVLDGCGGMLDCGTCAQGQTCGGAGPNKCGIGVCTPKTCVQLGAACGSLSDGCASVVDCGECEDGKICGGAGIPNQCACVPQVTCASMGAECGSIVDDCGNSLSCGTCGSGLYCGIQTANRCDPEPCTPVSCQMYGFECGIIDDGCGGTLDCGPCASTELCFSNVCCVSHAFQPCTYSCQVLMKTVLGYSQYESVWCSSEDQSLASIANCSEPDPDPCTTYHLEPNCGLIPGYRWCDVTCYRHTQCDGTADCYGNCG